MRKLIHKKEHREVYDDGKYIIKKMPTVWLDLETYNAFRKLHPEWLVEIIDIDQNTIITVSYTHLTLPTNREV